MFLVILSLPTIFMRMRSWEEIGVVAALLAAWVVFATCREKWKKYRTRGWPTATGTLTDIRSEKVDGGLNGVDYWKVKIDYRYTVGQEHPGTYSFNCATENMANGATAGLKEKTVCVHYKPSDEAKALLWEDEVWDIWWDTYWRLYKGTTAAASSD
jgi:hypothetical protein